MDIKECLSVDHLEAEFYFLEYIAQNPALYIYLQEYSEKKIIVKTIHLLHTVSK